MIDVTESQIFEAVRAFLLVILPTGTEVIRAQVNRVAPPKVGLWVAMTARSRRPLETTIETWDTTSNVEPTTLQHCHHTQVNIQLDIYGQSSADAASTIAALFRTPYSADYFATKNLPIAPLYATDGQQMPLVSGEDQYIGRWTLELALQANLTVSTNQDFLDTVTVIPVSVEAEYPV